jgi:hypothetical protein
MKYAEADQDYKPVGADCSIYTLTNEMVKRILLPKYISILLNKWAS